MTDASALSELPEIQALTAAIALYPADPSAIAAAGRDARRAQKAWQVANATQSEFQTQASRRDPRVNAAVDDAVLAFAERLSHFVTANDVDPLDPELMDALSCRAGDDFVDVWRNIVAEALD